MNRFAHQIAMTDFINLAFYQMKAGCLIASEMGAGKTRSVLDAIKPEWRCLVVVPAIARGEWVRQASLWAPHLHLTAEDTGSKVEAWCSANPTAGILVTSYQLLKHVTGAFDFICPDECQLISNPDAKMTQELQAIVNRSQETFIVALSGTPAMDRPDQLWSVLNLVEPGQWGSSIWSFRRHFCKAVPNEWAPSGVVYKGLRPDRVDELAERLSKVMFRVRKSDIADLPPLLCSLRYVKSKRTKLDWDNEKTFDELLSLNRGQKLDTVVELLDSARAGGETLFVVFTYLRQTADECGARLLAAGFEVEVVTGATPADARHAPIARVREAKTPAVLVCNIDAIGVSLDFSFCQTAIFAEQSWVPGRTEQAIGRLIRLSSTHSCNCMFVVVESSKEQRQSEILIRKQSDLSSIMEGSRDMRDAMKILRREESDDEVLRGLVS